MRKRLLVVLAGTFFLGTATASDPHDESPTPGEAESEAFMKQGELTTGTVCASACHGWEAIYGGPRQVPVQWDFVVSDMVGRGAMATAEQQEMIKRYLKRTWGAVWINTATVADIVAVIGLKENAAQAIVEYREKHGRFADLASVKSVPGVDPAAIEARAEAIIVN